MVSRRRATASLATLVLAVLGPLPRPALAQEPDAHGLAVQLFDEAGRAQDRRAFDEACPKFARVVELEPAKVGAKLALAVCYEQAGKLASAVAAYWAAGARAAEVGDPRQKQADDKVAELDAKAPRLTIDVPEPLRALPGLTVQRDGAPVDASQWSRPLLCDPGEHTIVVGAAGKKPWTGHVTVAAGAAAQVVIAGLEEASPPAPAAFPSSPPGGSIASAPAPDAPERKVPAWSWVSGGLGLAYAGAAIGFAVDQAMAQGDFNAQCKHMPQPAACADLSARLWRDFGLGIGLGVAGVTGIVASAIGIATAPHRRAAVHATAPVRPSFWIAPHGSGAALVGQF